MKTTTQILESALAAGTTKAALPWRRTLALALLAGAFIALGGLLSIIAGAAAEAPAAKRLLSGAVFPIGLILIVTLGGELFTGNNAVLIPPLAAKRTSMPRVLANWALVWLGNFAGALAFVGLFVLGAGTLDAAPWHDAATGLAEAKVSMPWLTVLCRAVGANWCVCLAVWMALGADTLGQKCLACWMPVAAFVALGWEHCIANMFFIPAGMATGADVSVVQMLCDNLVPATLGNIVGGALLVGCTYTLLFKPKR